MNLNRMKPDSDRARLGAVIPPHIQWLKARIAEGSVVQAGKWGDIGGIVIIKANDRGDAEKLLQDDPLVQSGLITCELAPFEPEVQFK